MPDNCITAPIALEICTPDWATADRLHLIEWEAGLVVDLDPIIAYAENCGDDYIASQEMLSTCVESRDQAHLTVAHLRGELRECRYELSQEIVDPSGAAGLGLAVALIAFGAWRFTL